MKAELNKWIHMLNFGKGMSVGCHAAKAIQRNEESEGEANVLSLANQRRVMIKRCIEIKASDHSGIIMESAKYLEFAGDIGHNTEGQNVIWRGLHSLILSLLKVGYKMTFQITIKSGIY